MIAITLFSLKDKAIKEKYKKWTLDSVRPRMMMMNSVKAFVDYSVVGLLNHSGTEYDFIEYEMNWLKIVIKSGKPFLGICLGAQMLAKHLGGEVKKIDCNSSEIGFYEILPSESIIPSKSNKPN